MKNLFQCLMIAVVIASLLAACGGRREIRDIPPLVQLVELELLEAKARVSLRIRNPNDLPLTGGELQFKLNVNGHLFAIYGGTPDIDVIAHSAEELRLLVTPIRQITLSELRNLHSRSDSMSWELQGSLKLEQSIRPDFKNKGRLSPVPGRADLFR